MTILQNRTNVKLLESGDSRYINKMSKLKEQFKLGEAFSYFFRIFGKADPSKPTNFNIKTMHFINKISIVMFLMCICVMIYRAFFR